MHTAGSCRASSPPGIPSLREGQRGCSECASINSRGCLGSRNKTNAFSEITLRNELDYNMLREIVHEIWLESLFVFLMVTDDFEVIKYIMSFMWS